MIEENGSQVLWKKGVKNESPLAANYLVDWYYEDFKLQEVLLYSSRLAEQAYANDSYLRIAYLIGWQDYDLDTKIRMLSFLRFHCENNPMNMYTKKCKTLSDKSVKYEYDFE